MDVRRGACGRGQWCAQRRAGGRQGGQGAGAKAARCHARSRTAHHPGTDCRRRDAAPAIAQYRKVHGDSASPRPDRSAERRQLQEAEQSLRGALLPLQKLSNASAAQLAPAWHA
ncbi:hypothetical protein LP419_39315 [Massilia sp. H-1]|nr:hypothetical protein LP419_39315 [Massilia sp. H-1]